MSLPAWANALSSMLITAAEYEARPADACRSIEVVDGVVVFCAPPTSAHQLPEGIKLDVLFQQLEQV